MQLKNSIFKFNEFNFDINNTNDYQFFEIYTNNNFSIQILGILINV